MTTVNDQLLRDRIRHAVDLQRYGNGVVNDIIALLNEADRDLMDKLAKRLDKVDTWTNRRIQAVIADIASLNADNYKEAANRLAKEMIEFAGHEAEQAAKGVESLKPPTEDLPAPVAKKIDVAFTMTLPTADQLAAIVSKEPITVGPDGKLLLEEIFAKLAAGKEDRIRQAVRLGMVEGETTPQIVRRLVGTRAPRYTDGILERDRRGVEAMVRTILNHTSNRAAALTYAANDNIIKGERWTSTLDGRTTIICQSRDGKVFPLGSTIRPPAHVNCRSFLTPVLKSWKELGIDGLSEIPESSRASMNGQVPASLTYPEWLRQHPEMAREALGATRARLFLEGNMPIESFVNNRGQTLTLAQLRERQAAYFRRAGVE